MFIKPSPFVNSGCSCWLNSLIQSLLSTPLVDYIATANDTIDEIKIAGVRDDDKNMLFNEFYKVCNAGGTHDRSALQILSAFKKQLLRSGNNFNIVNTQECALEAYTYMIEMLNDKKITKMFSQASRTIIKCSNCGNSLEQRNTNLFSMVEPGQSVPQLRRRGVVHDYKCEKCEIKRDALRAEILSAGHEVLVFATPKSAGLIINESPPSFDIPLRDGAVRTYHVCAFIEHYGSPTSGHYVAYGKRGDSWYFFNDYLMYPFENWESALKSPRIYMLFYKCDA